MFLYIFLVELESGRGIGDLKQSQVYEMGFRAKWLGLFIKLSWTWSHLWSMSPFKKTKIDTHKKWRFEQKTEGPTFPLQKELKQN